MTLSMDHTWVASHVSAPPLPVPHPRLLVPLQVNIPHIFFSRDSVASGFGMPNAVRTCWMVVISCAWISLVLETMVSYTDATKQH